MRVKTWRRKIVGCMVIGAVCTGLLAGCQQQKVDYTMGETEKDGDKNSNLGPLSEFQKAAEEGYYWTDSLEIEDSDGQTVSVAINAKLSVPDVEEMCVVEVRDFAFTPENKQKVAEAFFGEEVYACNTDELLEMRMEEYELLMEEYDVFAQTNPACTEEDIRFLNEQKEKYQERYDELQERRNSAPEELEKVSDYEDDMFIGIIGDIYYTLSFSDLIGDFGGETQSANGISIKRVPVCNKIIISPATTLLEEQQLAEMDQEARSKTEQGIDEEKKPELQAKLESIGLGSVLLSDSGMAEIYSTGVDGLPFCTFGSSIDYVRRRDVWNRGVEAYFDISDEIIAMGYGEENFSLTVQNPLEMVSVTNGVSMLPLEEAESILKSEIAEQMDLAAYTHGSSVTLNQLDLIYFRVSDTENEGYYSYVPAWRLSAAGCKMVVMINAIDGSAIDLEKELGIGEE